MHPVSNTFYFLLRRTLTSLYSYLAVLLDYHVCVQVLMVLRRKRRERKTTHRRLATRSLFLWTLACRAFWQLSGMTRKRNIAQGLHEIVRRLLFIPFAVCSPARITSLRAPRYQLGYGAVFQPNLFRLYS